MRVDNLIPLVLAAIALFALYKAYRKARQARRERLIDRYPFPPSIAAKVSKTYPHLSDAEVMRVMQGLREYFHLCNSAGRRMVSMPSQVVDVAWHEFNKYQKPEIFKDSDGPHKLAKMLVFREFMRRPKRQNSLETQGLVKVDYLGLDKVQESPSYWESKGLTLEDWRDLLKVALDFYVRENSFIQMNEGWKDWIGSRFSTKTLRNPESKEADESRVAFGGQSGTARRVCFARRKLALRCMVSGLEEKGHYPIM